MTPFAPGRRPRALKAGHKTLDQPRRRQTGERIFSPASPGGHELAKPAKSPAQTRISRDASSRSRASPCCRQKTLAPSGKSVALLRPSCPITERRLRNRHERWVQDAMDAGRAARRAACRWTAKSFGPGLPTLRSSFAGDPRKPGTPGESTYKP